MPSMSNSLRPMYVVHSFVLYQKVAQLHSFVLYQKVVQLAGVSQAAHHLSSLEIKFGSISRSETLRICTPIDR